MLPALVAALACLGSTSAAAQDSLVLRGLGGASFGQTTATPLIGAGVGVNLSPQIELTVEAAREFGRDDPRNVPVQFDEPGDLMTTPPGVPTMFIILMGESVRLDRYALAGARLTLWNHRRVRLFADGGGGMGRVTTRWAPNPYGYFGDSESGLLLAGGGGFSISMTTRVGLDVAYRHGRLFQEGFGLRTNDVRLALNFALH